MIIWRWRHWTGRTSWCEKSTSHTENNIVMEIKFALDLWLLNTHAARCCNVSLSLPRRHTQCSVTFQRWNQPTCYMHTFHGFDVNVCELSFWVGHYGCKMLNLNVRVHGWLAIATNRKSSSQVSTPGHDRVKGRFLSFFICLVLMFFPPSQHMMPVSPSSHVHSSTREDSMAGGTETHS